MSELYGKLRTEKGYSINACSLFRIMCKMGYFFNKEKHKKYIPKHYDTPKHCYSGRDSQKFYQYTVIDEASRERFIYHYMEHFSILLLILLNEPLFIFVTNQKLFKLIMVLNLHMVFKPIELTLLTLFVIL